jgi:hypothetical protein
MLRSKCWLLDAREEQEKRREGTSKRGWLVTFWNIGPPHPPRPPLAFVSCLSRRNTRKQSTIAPHQIFHYSIAHSVLRTSGTFVTCDPSKNENTLVLVCLASQFESVCSNIGVVLDPP